MDKGEEGDKSIIFKLPMNFQLYGPDLNVEEGNTALRVYGGNQVVPEPVIHVNNRANSNDDPQVVPQDDEPLSVILFPESTHPVQESFATAAADQVGLMMIRARQDPGIHNEQPPPSSIWFPAVDQLQSNLSDGDDQVVPQISSSPSHPPASAVAVFHKDADVSSLSFIMYNQSTYKRRGYLIPREIFTNLP